MGRSMFGGEYNWIITSELANQRAKKPLLACMGDSSQKFRKCLISTGAVKILFLSFTCEDIGVAMVTNIITQLL